MSGRQGNIVEDWLPFPEEESLGLLGSRALNPTMEICKIDRQKSRFLTKKSRCFGRTKESETAGSGWHSDRTLGDKETRPLLISCLQLPFLSGAFKGAAPIQDRCHPLPIFYPHT